MFGPASTTISRLVRPLHLLLLSPATLRLSLTLMQTYSVSTEIPFRKICGHSLCALMGKRRHLISPLAGPHGLGALEKLPSKAIRVLLASPCCSERLWSVSKQHEDAGTLSFCSASPDVTKISLPRDTASHYTKENC